MAEYECPLCGKTLRKRAMNYSGNLKRRTIEDIRDRFVCSSCEETFSVEQAVLVEDDETPVWFSDS